MSDDRNDVSTREVELDRQLGKRLRELRKSRGMTQETLARCAGITFQQIQKYERGANRISASRLMTLAQDLDINYVMMFDAPGTPLPRPASAE